MIDRLFIVLRGDLSPGLKLSQSIHAARQFAAEHREIEQRWFETSNTVSVLETDRENLQRLLEKAADIRIRAAAFKEPDLDNAVTAVAFEPGQASRWLCRGLVPALKSA